MSKHHYEYNKADSHGEAEISYTCAGASRGWVVFVNEWHSGIKFHFHKWNFKCFEDAEDWLMSYGRKGIWRKVT